MHLAPESGETSRPGVAGPGVHRRRVVLHRWRPARHAVRVGAAHAVESRAEERLVAHLPRGTVGHLGLAAKKSRGRTCSKRSMGGQWIRAQQRQKVARPRAALKRSLISTEEEELGQSEHLNATVLDIAAALLRCFGRLKRHLQDGPMPHRELLDHVHHPTRL